MDKYRKVMKPKVQLLMQIGVFSIPPPSVVNTYFQQAFLYYRGRVL